MSTAATDHTVRSGRTSTSPLRRRPPVWGLVLLVIAVWVAVWAVVRGQQTLYLPGLGRTGFHDWFTELKANLIRDRETNILMQITGAISDVFNSVVEFLQGLISTPNLPRPVPEIGWLGVVGLAVFIGLAVATWRMAVLVGVAFVTFGLLGYWQDSMDTLIITFFSVAIALVIGMPLAVLIGTTKLANSIVTPVLDLLQTLPSFVYLVPLALFFSLGPAAAVAATVLYALPPIVRIAGHGIREVSGTTIEATDSLGQSPWQRLVKVQLPMAKRTIIVGINQTIMSALSMVVIAAFVNGPGLGKPVLQALSAGQVGAAFVAGLCIVVMAVMLDRTTTVASERAELSARGQLGSLRQRRILLAVTGVAAVVMVVLSRRDLQFATFPETSIGADIARRVQEFNNWITSTFSTVTTQFQDLTTNAFINPLQDLLANSAWWLTGLAFCVLSLVIGGVRALAMTAVCLAGIYLTDLWYDAMVTLTSVLVATVFAMVLALVLGVWMARSRAADGVVRPILDAAQTMPPFVYLIPALGLFGPNRFMAIAAAIVYAAPPAIKLVADGVKAVSPTTIEAATAAGSTTWQIITKVQLPMARASLVLAANQGLLYVLSMVVIGGLVGGGALGYDVVLGFSQGEYFGKGVAAGIAIVLLGIMLDRTAREAAGRSKAQRSASPARLPSTIRGPAEVSAAVSG